MSELKVMQSAAGYYIGRSYFDLECECEFPYSRESGYMTQADAEAALATADFVVRDCIENNWAYDTGNLPDIREDLPVDHDDICEWPDGSWCRAEDLEELLMTHSDDFVVHPYNSVRAVIITGEIDNICQHLFGHTFWQVLNSENRAKVEEYLAVE